MKCLQKRNILAIFVQKVKMQKKSGKICAKQTMKQAVFGIEKPENFFLLGKYNLLIERFTKCQQESTENNAQKCRKTDAR